MLLCPLVVSEFSIVNEKLLYKYGMKDSLSSWKSLKCNYVSTDALTVKPIYGKPVNYNSTGQRRHYGGSYYRL